MKIEKSNNPAAAGALIVVLVLIVGRIMWMLLGPSRAVSAASRVVTSSVSAATAPVASSPPAPTVAPLRAAASGLPPPRAALTTARNPFTCSVRMTPAPEHLMPTAALRDIALSSHKATTAIPLPPLPIWTAKSRSGPTPGSPGLNALPVRVDRSASAQNGHKLTPEPSLFQTLKLTAIVDGTVPMAVVQTAHPAPIVLHIGDDVEGMRVITINDHEVVLAHGGSQWTLLLQSSADSSAAGSLSVTSVATPEENNDELQ